MALYLVSSSQAASCALAVALNSGVGLQALKYQMNHKVRELAIGLDAKN